MQHALTVGLKLPVYARYLVKWKKKQYYDSYECCTKIRFRDVNSRTLLK